LQAAGGVVGVGVELALGTGVPVGGGGVVGFGVLVGCPGGTVDVGTGVFEGLGVLVADGTGVFEGLGVGVGLGSVGGLVPAPLSQTIVQYSEPQTTPPPVSPTLSKYSLATLSHHSSVLHPDALIAAAVFGASSGLLIIRALALSGITNKNPINNKNVTNIFFIIYNNKA